MVVTLEEAPSPPKDNCTGGAVVVAVLLPNPPLKPNMVAVVLVTDVVTAGCAAKPKPLLAEAAPPKPRPTSKMPYSRTGNSVEIN